VSYVEILILRRLRSGPAHGYELRKRVEQTTGVVLHNNSLYPALKRFEEAGAVTKTAQPQDGRPPRLVYTLTEVGHELLHDMLADFPREQAADEGEFLARLGQFSLLSSMERAVVLAARSRSVREQLAHLAMMRDLASEHGERWGELVTHELIRRHTRELAWLAELAELAAHPDPDARPHSDLRSDPESDPAPDADPRPDPRTDPHPRPDPDPHSDLESDPAPDADVGPDPEAIP
jgi:DNA-binding PadR family transcriptional regulator